MYIEPIVIRHAVNPNGSYAVVIGMGMKCPVFFQRYAPNGELLGGAACDDERDAIKAFDLWVVQ